MLELLGFDWSKNLHHLAYGMVNLPQGKMKSREGTVVDADNLIGDLKDLAANEIKEKGRESEIDNLSETSEKIALSALNYFLLEPSPYKDIIFNPRESISFSGNTGPYLQYTGARISSMLRKFLQRKRNFQDGIFQAELLSLEEEWRIIKQLSSYPDAVELSARELNPSIITLYLYELSKNFSRFYHDHPVLHNKDPNLVVSRITLAKAVLQVLQNGFRLIGIPFLEKM